MRKNQTLSGENKMMTSETNIFSFGEIADPVEKARAALRAVRQYQQEWQELGTDRVYKYFDDVEGDQNQSRFCAKTSPTDLLQPRAQK